MRHSSLIVLGTGLALLLSGCTASTTGGDPAATGPLDPNACDGKTLSFIGLEGEQGEVELADWRAERDMTLQTTATTDWSQLISSIKVGQNFDLATLPFDEAQRMIEAGIFQPIDTSRLDNWADMVPGMAENAGIRGTDEAIYGAPIAWGDGPFVFRPDKVETDGMSILDLLKPEWKNRFVFFDSPGRSFYFLGKANGFDAPLYTPEELEIVAGQAQQLVENAAAFATNYQDATDRMVSGDIDLVINGWQAQLASAAERDVTLDFAYFDEGRTGWWDGLAIPTSSENTECALLYINEMIGVEAQTALAENLISGVVNEKAIDKVTGAAAVYDYAAVMDPDTDAFAKMTPPEEAPEGFVGYQEWLDAWQRIKAGS